MFFAISALVSQSVAVACGSEGGLDFAPRLEGKVEKHTRGVVVVVLVVVLTVVVGGTVAEAGLGVLRFFTHLPALFVYPLLQTGFNDEE